GFAGMRSYVALLSWNAVAGANPERQIWWKLESVPAIAQAFLPDNLGLPLTFGAAAIGILLFALPRRRIFASKGTRQLVVTYAYAIAVTCLTCTHVYA